MGYDFLFDLAIILFTAKMLSIVARKINLPEVVGQIAAGLLIGPAVLNIVKPDDFIRNIAEIGVIMLMFEVGLETDLKKLRSTGKKATLIAMGGVVLPLIAGAVLYLLFYGGNLSDSSVLIEALSCGKPVIGSNVGGINEIITEDVGLLIDPNAPSDLANAIDRVLSDKELMEKFKSNARDRAKDFGETKLPYDELN